MGSLVALVVFSFLPGCFTTPPPQEDASEPTRIVYVCPGKPDSQTPCLADIDSVQGRRYEPAAAAHPFTAGTFAVAATRVGDQIDHQVGTVPGTDAPNRCRVTVHLTEDDGRTWRALEPEMPPWGPVDGVPIRERCTRSPDVTFDDDGTLHMVLNDFAQSRVRWAAAQAEPGNTFVHRVLYLRSSDLGAGWTARVLADDANHPHVAFDGGSGLLVATVRDFEGNGFQKSAVHYSLDRGATWGSPLTVPCHLPTRPVFEDGLAVFACTDHEAMENGRLIRFYALDADRGNVSAKGKIPVPGATNLFTALAGAPDGRLALAWAPTVPGGVIDGDPFVSVASTCCDFAAPVNLRESAAPGFAYNGMGTTVRADPGSRFHLGIEVWNDAEGAFVHVVLGTDGQVAATTEIQRLTWQAPTTQDAAQDPLEWYFGSDWPGSLYPDFSFQDGSGILVTTANADAALQVQAISARTWDPVGDAPT